MATATKYLHHAQSVDEVEALAAAEGLRLAVEVWHLFSSPRNRLISDLQAFLLQS